MTNELADLEHALDLALKVDFALVPAAGKEDDLLAVTRIRNKVDVLDHRVLMPFDTAQQHRAQGHTSPVGWLEHNTLVLAILTGKVRGYLYDPDGVPLRYGRARDLFAKDQADSLRARYRRCAHPYGCGHTGHRLQSNHITERRHGGPTDVENGDPRCGPHNRWHTNTFGRPPPDGAVDRDQRRLPPDFGPLDFDNLPPPAPLRRPHLRRDYRWAS